MHGIFLCAIILCSDLMQVSETCNSSDSTHECRLQPYVFNHRLISKIERAVGCQINDDWVRRNGDGSRVDFAKSERNSLYIVSLYEGCSESEEHRLSNGSIFWDDKFRTIVSYDGIAKQVALANESFRERPPGIRIDIDPAGRFLMIGHSDGREHTEIFSVESLDKPIATSQEWGERIFSSGDSIFLFSRQYDKKSNNIGMRCETFALNGNEAKCVESILIKRPARSSAPFYVVDMDPSGRRAVFYDHWDLPLFFLSRFVLYDFETGKMHHLRFGGGHALFLKPNMLSEVLRRKS